MCYGTSMNNTEVPQKGSNTVRVIWLITILIMIFLSLKWMGDAMSAPNHYVCNTTQTDYSINTKCGYEVQK